MDKYILVSLFFIVACFEFSDAQNSVIECYACNSKTNKNCLDPFNSKDVDQVKCTLAGPYTKETKCSKAVFRDRILGNITYRGCVYTTVNNPYKRCPVVLIPGTGNPFNDQDFLNCTTCDSSFCNGATNGYQIFSIPLIAAILCLIANFH